MGTQRTTRKTDRLEAFSDAVLAIAITLPLVELKAPKVARGDDLAASYVELWPDYLSYALGFTVIGLFWIHSHFNGKIVRETDHGFNLLTLLFLASVSVTPFPTLPFVEHFNDPSNGRSASAVYAGVLTLPMVVWLLRWLHASRNGLLDPHLNPSYIRRLTIKYAVSALAALLGLALTLLGSWRLGIGLTGAVVLANVLPPTTPSYKPGEEPKSDLEEADERDD